MIDESIENVNQILKIYRHPEIPLDRYEFYNNKKNNIKLIKCKKNETIKSCDLRVDKINR